MDIDKELETAGDVVTPPELHRLGVIAAIVATTAVALLLIRLFAPPEPSAEELARVAADRFLDHYMEPDGRVVRRDQGGDTVSEGQAYAMLLAVALGDQSRFELAWSWTKAHLRRSNGLFAWHWSRGRVLDSNSAADADVDTAYALVLAAQHFHQPRYLQQGRRIARSILTEETVDVAGATPLLVAGPWARTAPYVINPSYFAPSAFVALGKATGNPRWGALVRSSHRLVNRLVYDPSMLPSDWAEIDDGGTLRPIGSPNRADERHPRYGLDAPRLLVRLATDCSERSRRLAAVAGRLLPLRPGQVAASYDLRGKPLAGHSHPLADVAASAVALALGDGRNARDLLEHAESLERRASTYYGAAWLAIGRVMLTTTLLTDCTNTRAKNVQELTAS